MRIKVLPQSKAARTRLAILLGGPALLALAYVIWSPGLWVSDGRHDRGTNGIWAAHGWLGDDAWFANNRKDQLPRYRSDAAIAAAVDRWRKHHVRDVFPHLAPAQRDGRLPGIDGPQVKRFLDATDQAGQRVMPWIGGVLHEHCFPERQAWRDAFVASVVDLLKRQPRLAGVHVNIEPWPDGHAEMLLLVEELRAVMPRRHLLSIAAYPPPTRWQPNTEIHWSEGYFRKVAARSDQLSVMMYDTSIRFQKPYRKLMADWTREVLAWSQGTPVLLGLPAYEDTGVGYHHPHVENIRNALHGIHAGLASHESLPAHYHGIVIYSDWTTDEQEWGLLRRAFLKLPGE